uniref:Acyl-peptide hydrolase n=1 Tax=Solibacter usitatus (strain Ellin6076) TaxID=234267 RepID=Q027J1_SOLUE
MRLIALCALALTASAQPSLDRLLSAAFPSELTAAPAGGKVAWVSNAKGLRNIMVAEPPAYVGRKITTYAADDGQEISDLRWTPDSSAIVYVRGGSANPALDPAGVTQAIWRAALDGTAARKIGEGNAPAVSPKGDKVVFIRAGQLWWAPLDGKAEASQVFQARGACDRPRWSPDGARISFTSARGDHGFIGVFDVAAGALRYLDPSTDNDSEPEWSPDGRSVAFLRVPSSGVRMPREPHRTGEPWSIRIADAHTGAGREVFHAREGAGSVFRGVNARNQILWADGNRLVFPWEPEGWTHLYAVSTEGGKATLLTPGKFEVEDVAVSGKQVLYSSNQDDIDRRHLWKVAADGGVPTAITSGQGIECQPAPTSDPNVITFLRSDAQRPLRAAVSVAGAARDLDPGAIPSDFPTSLATPQQVVFPAGDGLAIHGQLFLPTKKPTDGRSPAIVFFHGGSRRQMLLGWHYMYYYANAYAMNQYLASLGYVVLSVNYRSGIGYGSDFREAVNYGANGGTEYNDVQGAGIYLQGRTDVDGGRIGVWGGSYGGYLTAMALARASDMYKVGVDFHGVHNWATELGIPVTAPDYKIAFESSPMNFLKTWQSPVLLIQGDDDPDVQFNQTVMLADALRKQGVEIEEMVIPDEVHDFLLHRSWLTTYKATAEFLRRHLK